MSYTGKKTEEEKQKKNKSVRHFSPSYKHKKKENNEVLHREEVEKEIEKRKNLFKEFIALYSAMKNNMIMEESNSNEYNEFFKNNGNSNKKENSYLFIINRTWFNQFKSYCKKKEISYSNINEDYPGQINNQHLILKEDTSLKLNNEKKLVINSKFRDNCTCIKADLWNFLIKNFGGGPEIKFIHKINENNNSKNNELEVLIKAVHINLLFIPKKEIISNNNNKEPSNNINNPLNPFQCQDIKKILINNDSKSKFKIYDIYFDINKNVQDLINYTNQILNQHRHNFTDTPIYFGPNYNSERNSCLVDNINYRLWLNNLDMNPIEISNYIYNQIKKYEDVDFLMKFSQMDKLDIFNGIPFSPFLLSGFAGYKVEDIFPNKYTKNFQNHDYYNTKYEDDNSFPTFTILIEEFPYHFEEPKRKYFIKKCNFCCYRDYVYSGCICQKVFYCCDICKKKDLINHVTSCKKGLFHFISERNEKLYRVILGRKEYFEKNKNEKQIFPNLGLTNLGNSCYMNSSLQCLFAIKELTNYFLYYFKEEYLNKENVLGTGGVLTSGYINLLLTINNSTSNKYFSPEIFKIILGLCSQKYEGNEQEDAHEFINYLLDMLHEDLNKVSNRSSINQNDNSYNPNYLNASEEEKSIIDWNNFLKRNQSVLIDLFYGQYKSCVICPKCNFKSVSFNSFLSLELPISENKNFVLIQICFIDHLKECPHIFFNIFLHKNELKIFILRKKIANFLNIDVLEFELAYLNNKGEIIHIFEISENIPNEINYFHAFRINPYFFYSPNNERIKELNKTNEYENENVVKQNFEEIYKIDFNNLEYNIKKRRNEIIEFNENKNINDDYLYFSLKFNDNIGLNKNIYQKCILQSCLIKKRKNNNLEMDEIIYLEKNKKCKYIYLEIFKKYALNIVFQSNKLNIEKKKKINNILTSGNQEEINKMMNQLFLFFFRNVSPNGEFKLNLIKNSDLDLINNFPPCPFILFLKNIKNNIIQKIPIFESDEDYNEFLGKFYNNIKIPNNDKEKILKNENNKNNINFDLNNQDYNQENFAEYVSNVLSNNNINIKNNNETENGIFNNNYDINKDNDDLEKEEKKSENDKNGKQNQNGEHNGLSGGGQTNSKNNNNSDNEEENEENEEKEEKEENEGEEESETENDNNHENSEKENDNNAIKIDDLSSNSDSNNSTKKSKFKDIDNNDENINIQENIKTEKDENIDRILIVWNKEYIKQISRYQDINLFEISDRIYEKSSNQEISIEKCFEEFSKEEKLDKENLWKCPDCKQNLQANKKIEIYNVPKILIIHLKRFNNNRKINTMINFPLENLEIDNYINKINKGNNKYDLFGVINHYGTLEYGHYTAFCKNYHDNNWYEYNDRIVNQIQSEREKETIVNQNAYVLFYRERKNDLIIWENIYNKAFENINENNLKKFGEDFIYKEIKKNDIKEDEEMNKELFSNEIDIEDDKDNKKIEEKFQIPENFGNLGNDDDNFSFKEGANNFNNIIEENKKKINNNIIEDKEVQTPKFKNNININKIKRIEENMNTEIKANNKNDNKIEDSNQNNKNMSMNMNNIINSNNTRNTIYKTQAKEKLFNEQFSIYKTLAKSKDNVFRITTFKKNKNNNINSINNSNSENIKKNKNNKNTKQKDNISSSINLPIGNKENYLLQFDIFNQSKNYFKSNKNKAKKPYQSVRSKELTNFLLKEYSDNISDQVPRSKKLYDESNLKTENKIYPNIILKNEKEIKEKIIEEKIVAIKEEDSENLKYVNKCEFDLEDYVYNPFRNCYAKIRKFL